MGEVSLISVEEGEIHIVKLERGKGFARLALSVVQLVFNEGIDCFGQRQKEEDEEEG